MSNNFFGLGFMISAKDQASAVIQRIERSLGTLGPAAQNAGKALATAFVAVEGFRLGVGALKDVFGLAEDAGKFEQKLKYLGATAGATGAELAQFRARAIDFGLHSYFSPEDAVEGMKELAAQGFNAAKSMNLVGDALKFASASAGELTVGQSAGMLAQIMKSFPTEKDAARITNIAARLANESAATFGQLPDMFSQVTRGSGAMKQSLVEVAATLGLVKNVVHDASSASTAVGSIMLRLTQPKHIVDFEKATGVTVFDRATNSYRKLLDIMTDMAASPIWNRLQAPEQSGLLTKVFGQYQQKAIEGILVQLRGGIEDVNGKMVSGARAVQMLRSSYENAKKEGALDAFVDLTSLPSMEKQLTNKLDTIGKILGRAFLPLIGPVFAAVLNILTKFGELLDAVPQSVMVAGAGIVLAVALAATLTFGFIALSAAVSLLSAVMGILGATIWATFVVPFLAVMSVMALVGIAAAGLYAAWKNNLGGLHDFVGNLVEKVSLAFQVIKQLFTEGGTFGAVNDEIMKPENSGLLRFLMTVWTWIGRVGNLFKGIWAGFQAGLERVQQPVSWLVTQFQLFLDLLGFGKTGAAENADAFDRWGLAGESIGEVLSALANVIITVFGAAMGAVNIVVAAFVGTWELLGPAVMSAFSMVLDVFDFFSAVFSGNWEKMWHSFLNLVIDVFKFIFNLFGSLLKAVGWVVDAIGSVGGANWNLTGTFDDAIKSGIVGLSKMQFHDARSMEPKVSPAAAALGSQVSASGGSPAGAPVTVQNQVHTDLHIREEVLASTMADHQRQIDARNYMSMAPETAR